MTAIRFPNSVGIGSNSGRTENSHHEVKGLRRIVKSDRGSDVIEISSEAKIRFEKDNLIRLEKVKLFKEAIKYSAELAEDIKFKEADLRNVYRLGKISDAKEKIRDRFYDLNEEFVLKKLLQKPEV
jgi:anti-sigma28 factor (negative regulator of flagellin synthesis)